MTGGVDPGRDLNDPEVQFHTESYLRHNERRLRHLASLDLPLAGRSVLEVGAGIGDHTGFFLARGCSIVTSDGRAANLRALRARYPHLDVRALDLDRPQGFECASFDIVHCYGLLYHLAHPAEAIAFMAQVCRSLLLLETCVSFGDDEAVRWCDEPAEHPTQSIAGRGCRPTRRWVYRRLRDRFEHVYVPLAQPDHEEFPVDWTTPPASPEALIRSVFIAAREPIPNAGLVEDLPSLQTRYCRVPPVE
jgi:SAM-dependent methyltransferase